MRKLVIIFLLVAAQVHAQGLSDKKQDLEKTKKKIQTQKKQLETLTNKEDSILKKLNQIDQKKSTTSRSKRWAAQKNLKIIDGEIDQTSSSIDQRKQKISDRRGSISAQLRDLYMHGEMNYMKMFLASASFEDLGQKQFLVRQWVDHDRKKIANFQDEARNLIIEKEIA
jgi:peptidoglycan hydrolase CwlO-like protein